MKVLVTGAGGFLGRAVTAQLRARGHQVRALARRAASATAASATAAEPPDLPAIEHVVADLRHADLAPLLAGVDAVIHLATTMQGDDFTIFAGTVGATERLFDALARSAVRRLVLVSSFSVYDWRRVGGRLEVYSRQLERPFDGGGYAAAKVWQERLARRLAQKHGVELTIARPGFIWSVDGPPVACFGVPFRRAFALIGPWRAAPLTHVVNCADAIAAMVAAPTAVGRTYNVVDPFRVSGWRYVGAEQRRRGRGWRLPIPGFLARIAVGAIDRVARLVFGPTRKLPSLCDPLRFRGRFAAVRVDGAPLVADLDWHPPLPTFADCLAAAPETAP